MSRSVRPAPHPGARRRTFPRQPAAVHHANVSHTTLAASERAVIDAVPKELLIGGEWQEKWAAHPPREGGHQGIHEYLSVQYVAVDAG